MAVTSKGDEYFELACHMHAADRYKGMHSIYVV